MDLEHYLDLHHLQHQRFCPQDWCMGTGPALFHVPLPSPQCPLQVLVQALASNVFLQLGFELSQALAPCLAPQSGLAWIIRMSPVLPPFIDHPRKIFYILGAFHHQHVKG